MKKFIFTIASILAITSVFVACSSENDAINYEDYKNQRMKYEYIDFSIEMSSKVKEKKLREAEQRILDNIRIIDGKISLSHTNAEELCLEREYFEFMKFLLEDVKNPQDILMPKTRSTTLSNGETGQGGDGIGFGKETVGNLIRQYLKSGLETKCFDQYWYSRGDMTLTDSEWNGGVKQCAESRYVKPNNNTNTSFTTLEINFSNSNYHYAFGTATIYFEEKKAVGLYDYYNFDFKFFQRDDIGDELKTIGVGFVGSLYGATPYTITYGRRN